MTCDSGSRPTGRDVEQARGEARQSGAESASPKLHRETPMPDNKLTCTDETKQCKKCEAVGTICSSCVAAMHSARPIPTGYEELRERLREQARSESAASKMLADAKTARQTDRDDYPEIREMVGGYSYSTPEQTVSWQAADTITTLLTKLAEVERERDVSKDIVRQATDALQDLGWPETADEFRQMAKKLEGASDDQ